MTPRPLLAVCAIAACVLAAGAYAAPPATTTRTTSVSTPAANSMIEFHDQHGRPISSSQFTAAVKKGQRYTAKEDLQAGKILMTLLPLGVNAPGSISSAPHITITLMKAPSVMEAPSVHYKVVFHDIHGKPIDLKTFTAGAPRHQRYTTQFDKARRLAVLTLLPIGANAPGSNPTSDLAMTSPSSMQAVPKPGTTFPSFDLPRVGGGRIDSANLTGKPYVVDFFFAKCIGCIAELPMLDAYHQQYPRQPVFAVTFDDARTAAGFVKQRRFNWPVAYDGLKFIINKLGVNAFPTMVVVGADGKVLASRIGSDSSMTPKTLETWITASMDDPHKQAGAP